jgi:predicted acyl esterase
MPNAVYMAAIELLLTNNLFTPSHRLRFEISSANLPHFYLNPNLRDPEGVIENVRIGGNESFADGFPYPTSPSRLLREL